MISTSRYLNVCTDSYTDSRSITSAKITCGASAFLGITCRQHDKDDKGSPGSASRSAGVSCACDIVPRHCTCTLTSPLQTAYTKTDQHQIDDRLRSSTVAFAGYDQLTHQYGRSIHPSQVAHGSVFRGLRPFLLSSDRSLGRTASEGTSQLAYHASCRDPCVVVGYCDRRVWRLQDL
jgi:hypothetical protein